MSEADLARRAQQYADPRGLMVGRQLGCGVHGIVFSLAVQPEVGIPSHPEQAVAALLAWRRKQRWGSLTLEAGLATRRDKLQDTAALLAAGRYHRQNVGHIPAALGTGRPVAALPPQHRVPQRTLRRVVRRPNALDTPERPQRRLQFQQLPADPRRLGAAAC